MGILLFHFRFCGRFWLVEFGGKQGDNLSGDWDKKCKVDLNRREVEENYGLYWLVT